MVLSLDLETVPAGAQFGLGFGDWARARLAERLAETAGKSDFLKCADHRIVATGFASIDAKGAIVQASAGSDEPSLISEACRRLGSHPTLLGWNTAKFDLPVLRYRALAHVCNAKSLYLGEKQWERYDYRYGDKHIDLMDRLSGFGTSTPLSLAEAAALCGLPAKPISTGSEVIDLVEQEAWHVVRAYVGNDAATTLAIYLRWQLTAGRLSRPQFCRSVHLLIEAIAGTPYDAGLSDALLGWTPEAPSREPQKVLAGR